MKKYSLIKTLQLILFSVFAIACIIMVFVNQELFHTIANDPDMKMICTLLWICFGLSFIFIFIDFGTISSYKKDYHELEHAVHSDRVTGIANRNSLDVIIEQYLDKPLPQGLGCVTFTLTNLKQINETQGYLPGTAILKAFSVELNMSSLGLCTVGRNGGNKFLAIFENSSKDKLDLFLSRVQVKVNTYNKNNPDKVIEYKFGVAFEEDPDTVKTINELIALSEKRIYPED